LNKKVELLSTIDRYKPAIIGLAETWLKEEVCDGEISINNYDVFRNDRMHGGVLLYIKSSLNAIRCFEEKSFDFEDSVWCQIKMDRKENLLIGVIYRSSNSEE